MCANHYANDAPNRQPTTGSTIDSAVWTAIYTAVFAITTLAVAVGVVYAASAATFNTAVLLTVFLVGLAAIFALPRLALSAVEHYDLAAHR